MADFALHDRVNSVLSRNPYLTGRTLKFEAQQGRVVLHGVVRSYFQKQMAQESLRRVEGVQQIENNLQVLTG